MGQSRKNVLLIITDQQRATQIFESENGGAPDLPAMDRLAKHGLSFNTTTCNTCMCSPSRTTLFTSQYPAQTKVTQTLSYDGVYAVGQHSLDPNIPNMGNIFANAGYDVQYRGKWHLSKAANRPADPNAVTAADIALFGFKGWVPPDAGEDASPEHFGGGWPNQDAKYIAEAHEWLKKRRDSDTEDPFLMVLSLVNPHDVLGYPSRYKYGYTDEDLQGDLTLPPSVNENLNTNHKPKAQVQLKAVSGAGLGLLNTPEKQTNYLNFYANLCSKIDHQIDELLLELFYDEDGPNDFFNDMLIIRTSDHGEMGMSHGGLRQKAYNVYEEVLRVPMIWANPDWFPEAQETDNLFSLVDVLPTLVGKVLDGDVPSDITDNFAGVDATAMVNDPSVSVQDQVLFTFDDVRASSASQEYVVNAPDRIRCVRQAGWKYAEYFDADSTYAREYELYDLTKPSPQIPPNSGKGGLEYHNLYYDDDGNENQDPKIQDQIATMQQALADLMADKLYSLPGQAAYQD